MDMCDNGFIFFSSFCGIKIQQTIEKLTVVARNVIRVEFTCGNYNIRHIYKTI